MIQKTTIVFCICLMSLSAFCQDNSIQSILQKIETNNSDLKTSRTYIESQTFALKSTNVLPNPEASTYYLPFGQTVSGNYTEFQLSQSFEFPTVYSARKKLIGLQKDQLETEYLQKRQQILVEAQQLVQQVIALNKQEQVEAERAKKAEQLFSQIQTLFDKEHIGILELNKAKIAFMNTKFKVQNIQVEKENLLKQIQMINGGNNIQISLLDYETDFSLPKKDSLWQEIQKGNQSLAYHNQSIGIAQQNINLTRAKQLPNLSIGYNYQGFAGDNYSGILAGVSLPLWGNKLRKNAARSALEFSKSNADVQVQMLKSNFESQYDKYISLLKMYEDYNSVLSTFGSEELLYKAYDKGQISFSQYFIELDFYHTSHDAMLDMEEQLQLLKSQLLKYKL